MAVDEKKCTMCSEIKSIICFSKLKSSKDGFKRQCKDCLKKIDKKYTEKNKDELKRKSRERFWEHREALRERSKRYYEENKEEVKARVKKYAIDNKEKVSAKNKESWKNRDKEKTNKKKRDWLSKVTDPQLLLGRALRRRFYMAIKGGAKGGSAVRDLGCSIKDFKIHIEGLFEVGMSWDNWGVSGWHLDHIEPLCSFDLTIHEDVKIACNYKNIRPLWAGDNRNKSTNDAKKKKR